MRHHSRPGVVLAGAIALGLLTAGPAAALTINVDGDPSDWGIDPGAWGASDWEPFAGVQGTWGGDEDFNPSTPGGQVYPGYGGQAYDAEAMYFTFDGTYAYFAVVSGVPPTGTGDRTPGDIIIDIGRDGIWDFGIETTGNDGHVAGALYENAAWTSPNSFGQSAPFAIGSAAPGSPASSGSLFYTSLGDGHYLIEAGVPAEKLGFSEGSKTSFAAHWTMRCGNDTVDMEGEHPVMMPEPASCTLLGSGLLAALALRLRKRKGKARRQAERS